ncbi:MULTISPECIES: DNA cytosine methyltransferase [Micromonospora]|uniref:DNA cytosine methyltransferase n=1 Tax=Micromonospora TaxID=1873 RepID=UPI0003EEC14E|nr:MULTISPECIES: DNA cytosine methyltransferase [unclassified Micromonospora]EWM65736.1 DNA (cytosine-5-)-methyltransferase [Micromonospora sp. M42]MCK1807155.1 DNA cytosine methyltransferase [Micromonospora sp. R42106]MCK1832179.1 DNA cytosine methyltransferase [Micromonospora sp. R42003]MCK1843500.1 DNA cytosine methyltransferase [Micromonospora sp. R42004]MCM1019942.1 DNA cytosine methyltransferase [Micromonospora sp. XM-20-01]
MTQLALIPSDAGVTKPAAAEFFAGIGLVRIGLEEAGIRVIWSNDIEPDKRDMYVRHFQDLEHEHTFQLGDVAKVTGGEMPEGLSLAWASFPCTDLSLAGARRGLAGSESGTFWHLVRVLEEMGERRPPVVALENVVGLATSHGGEDLAAAIRALNDLGYSVDVLTLDARRFVPQSRPRLFLVGAIDPPADEPVPNSELRPDWLQAPFGDSSLRTHRAMLPAPPPPLTTGLTQLADKLPLDSDLWWDGLRRAAFIESLSPIQAERLEALRKLRRISRRTAYRRTRGGKPTWEIRPDDISGCLRTARGGSSKQAVVEAGHGKVRVRWMTPGEYARLMGAGDYHLEGLRTNQALFGFGDAVCVPVVSWLAREYLMPLVRGELRAADPPHLAVVGA